MKKRNYNSLFIFLFLILVSLPVILPYFHNGYFPTHDGEWAVVRLTDMFRSLRDHQFPVRYSGQLNFGYGYPLFNFTYPAPYYIGVFLHFLKIGFVDSIKLMFALSVVLSAITMYLLSSEVWRSKAAGFISAIFYIYLPYRIVDLYARGSLGESLSFALFPIILYCALKISDGVNTNRYIVLGALSYALLITTHNIMAVLFTPLLFIFIALKLFTAKKRSYLSSFAFIALSYSLSAFFWLPALLEKSNIALSQVPIADRNFYFVKLHQLLIPKWGYGLPDGANGFSYQLGPAHVITLLLVAGLLIYTLMKKKLKKDFQFLFAITNVAIIFNLILMMFPFTKAVWKITPILREINYPWTLLAPIGFLISMIAGFLWTQKSVIKYLLIVLCLSSIVLTLPNAKPQHFVDKGDDYYLTNDATTTSSDELMPLWVNEKPLQRAEKKVEIIKGEGSLQNIVSDSKKLAFSTNLQTDSVIQASIIYWPGWAGAVDGKESPITYNNQKGLMNLALPKGDHKVEFNFTETPVRLISDVVSLISFVAIAMIIFTSIFKKKI